MTTTRRFVASTRSLTKHYGTGTGRVTALNNIDLDIEHGKITAIMGPSGSGKSTLMQVMAGLDDPTGGSVTIGDIRIDQLSDDARTVLRRHEVGFVFQAFNLVPTLTVEGNVRLPFELAGSTPDREQAAWIEQLLSELGLLSLRTRRPHELSGGQQQRVAIARALAPSPTLIFADEPTGALDSRTGREVLDLMASLTRRHQQSIVLVTHDPVAASYADRVIFLVDGSVVHDRGTSDAQTLSEIVLSLDPVAGS